MEPQRVLSSQKKKTEEMGKEEMAERHENGKGGKGKATMLVAM